jgi:hypothetical protein
MLALLGSSLAAPGAVLAQSTKPNILVIFGDDVGIANISAYSGGLMGYSSTITASSRAPRVARPSSPASTASAPASRRSGSRERPWA